MINIVFLVSRMDYLESIFANLEFLDCDPKQTNLLVIVDGSNDLYVYTRNKTMDSKFADKLCIKYEGRDKTPFNLKDRRERIARIHNFAKEYLSEGEYIFGIEDDTTFPTTTLKQLLKDFEVLPFAGIIQGYQVGRHGIPYYGAWKTDDIYEPTEVTSMEKGKEIEECDATGMYCFLTKQKIYIKHKFKVWGDNVLGPDVDFGLGLRKQGLKNYTDWRIPCLHYNGQDTIRPDDGTMQVEIKKVGGHWKQRIVK